MEMNVRFPSGGSDGWWPVRAWMALLSMALGALRRALDEIPFPRARWRRVR
jgi:hypothetical protein